MKSKSKSLSLLPGAPKAISGSSKTRSQPRPHLPSSSEPILVLSSPVSLKSSSVALQPSQRRRVDNMPVSLQPSQRRRVDNMPVSLQPSQRRRVDNMPVSLQPSQRRRVDNMPRRSRLLSYTARDEEDLLARGRELKKQMLNVVIGIRDDLRNLRRDFHRYTVETKAHNSNEVARRINASVHNLDEDLIPLRGLNNKYIENFPQTIREVQSLNAVSVNALLIALQAPTTGDLEQKRKTALKYIGVLKIGKAPELDDYLAW